MCLDGGVGVYIISAVLPHLYADSLWCNALHVGATQTD